MSEPEQDVPIWQLWVLAHPVLLVGLIALLALGIPAAIVLYLDHRIAQISHTLDEPRPPNEPSGAVPGELPQEILVGQTVYVPLYSHIYQGDGERLLLAGTLSIRNTDPKHGLTISGVNYYSTQGELVRNFLKSPLTLKPLGSTDFLVKESDTQGGAGANFIVEWVSDEPVREPIIEAVMVGRKGNSVAAFARSGVVTNQIRSAQDTGR